jgi:hypothetical protein
MKNDNHSHSLNTLSQQWEPRSCWNTVATETIHIGHLPPRLNYGWNTVTMGTEVNAGSQQWPRVTLSQHWPWIPVLRMLSFPGRVHSSCEPWLLTKQMPSPPVICREAHLLNLTILQRVYLSHHSCHEDITTFWNPWIPKSPRWCKG